MTDFFAWLESLPISTFITQSNSLWSFPMFLFAHTLGMSIVAGGASLMDLALLGCWPTAAPIKPLERLYPAIWMGFWVNLVTGSVLLVAEATKRLTNPDFFVKMVFVSAGVYLLNMKRRRIFDNPQLDAAPLSGQAKLLAWLSLACWFGAILTGRLLAYTSTSR